MARVRAGEPFDEIVLRQRRSAVMLVRKRAVGDAVEQILQKQPGMFDPQPRGDALDDDRRGPERREIPAEKTQLLAGLEQHLELRVRQVHERREQQPLRAPSRPSSFARASS